MLSLSKKLFQLESMLNKQTTDCEQLTSAHLNLIKLNMLWLAYEAKDLESKLDNLLLLKKNSDDGSSQKNVHSQKNSIESTNFVEVHSVRLQ